MKMEVPEWDSSAMPFCRRRFGDAVWVTKDASTSVS